MGKKRKFQTNNADDYWDFVVARANTSEEVTTSSDEPKSLVAKYSDKFCNASPDDHEDISEDDFLVSRAYSKEDVWKSETECNEIDCEGTDLFREVYVSTKAKKSFLQSDLADSTECEKKSTEKHSDKALSATTALSNLKDEQMSLQQLENAVLAKITLIRHDDGVYYYNGRTYEALKNDLDILELIRGHGISQNAFQSRSLRVFQDLYLFLKTDPYLIPSDYEERLRKSRHCVVLENGVLNVKKMQLHTFHSKYLTFHSVKACWVSNPNPKRFMKFLNDAAMGDQEIVRLTLEMIGYLISSLNTSKKFFVIGTAGNSGKSTLAALIEFLIGKEFVTAIPPQKLGDRFALGSTRGKILNLAMDIPNGKLSASAVSCLKSITGKDAIVIEEKYQRSERTVSNLRFLFGTNYPVTLPKNDDEDSFWERMMVIPFVRSVPPSEIDVDLLDDLLEEKDDIVSLCLQNLNRVIKNNYTFSSCKKSEEMKQSWRRVEISTASFYYFWNECVEVTGDMQDEVYASDLQTAYSAYCNDNGLEPVPYLNMLNWINYNVDPNVCCKKRIHKTNANPMSGFAGIKIR